jgi:hypothetical protein
VSSTLTEPTTSAEPGGDSAPDTRLLRPLGYLVLAAVAYLPPLLTHPGRVVADTKSYLYLDPGRLLERAPSMWDPNIGLGTVTHQNIGYLFPMGPYYWVTHAVGVPAWVAQRLWLGTILLFAALGVLYLLRTLHVRGPGVVAAAFVFMLSPYVLDFAARLSVILLPWAGLPWMLALVIRALREDGWAYPAVVAVVVQIVGSVNATALVFAGVVPALWILYATFVTREVDWRRAANTVAKIASLTILASLWWIVGLSVQSAYGLDILRFTETLTTVSHASLPSEVLRSLGYWFFYGGDRISAWIDASVRYTQDLPAIAASYALPFLAFAAAAIVRWRHRAFFVLVLVVGFVVAVGAHPYDDPSLLGGAFKSFAQSSSFGLALRSTARAVPLIALGTAVLIGLGVNAVAASLARRNVRWAGLALAGLVIVLAMVNLPALFNGSLYPDSLLRDEDIPSYWTQAIAELDRQPHDTRILEVPGADFAAYRWGGTVDPITPGLTDRPYVARELVPWGSVATANLLNAFDRRLQEGVLDPAAIAPIARLMSVGDVVYRADLETDRFDLARAEPTWELFTRPTPDGLGTPSRYGLGAPIPLHYSQLDELALARAPGAHPPQVSVFPVRGAPSIVRAASARTPLVVSGDGEGLVDLAALGGLDPNRVVLYSGTFADDIPALRRAVAEDGAVVVVTDSNRKRGRRWGAIKQVDGPTERVDEQPSSGDEGDQRLDLFPAAGPSAQTVVESPHVEVTTSGDQDVVTYFPESRGARAFDGDVDTAWEVDRRSVIGRTIHVDSDEPVTTGRVNLVQPLVGPRARYITTATLRFDGGDPVVVHLGDASRTADGETFEFPERTFRRLEVTIDDTNVGDSYDFPTNNRVGFAEIRVRDDVPGAEDIRVRETVRMPTDLVDASGDLAADRPLVYVMSRSRNVVVPPRFSQDEQAIVRKFRVPNERSFAWGGTARLAAAAPDDVLDRVLGIPDAAQGGITVRASEHLPGDVAARGSSAFDEDVDTAWTTAFGEPVGQWVEAATPEPVSLSSLDFRVIADGRHSVPTQIRIDGGGQSRTVDIPPIADQEAVNGAVAVPLAFEPLTSDTFRVTITAVRPVTTVEYHENQPIVMPVGIVDVGMPGITRAPVPEQMPSTCRTDLVSFDGEARAVRLGGSTARAVDGGVLTVEPCDLAGAGAATALALDAGDHRVVTARGVETGVDVDGLVLGSDADGEPLTVGAGGSLTAIRTSEAGAAAGVNAPHVEVVHDGRTKMELRVHGADPGAPFWLVLGQSNNAGWEATVDGADATVVSGDADGRSTLVDGYANGWQIVPQTATFDVTLEWTPQQTVWIALAISATALLGCLVLAIAGRRRRGRRADVEATAFVDGPIELGSPFRAVGSDVAARTALVTSVCVAFAAGAVAQWWVGLAVGALTAAALAVPRLRALLAIGAPVCVALTAAYVMVQQYRYGYPYGFFWVDHFTGAASIAWLAVLLLAADAVVELVRRARARRDATAAIT